jgi:Cof subfamily protein (haloacid dehalogenase superfamily)
MPRCNRVFLRNYLDNGGKLILASGRSTMIKSKVEKMLHHEVTLLGCNGAYICDSTGIYNKKPLDQEESLKVFVSLRHAYGALFWLLFDDEDPLYICFHGVSKGLLTTIKTVNKLNGFYREKMIDDENMFIKRLSEHENYKLMCAFGIGNNADKKAAETFIALKDQYADYFTTALSDNAIEITAKGVDKGIGLTNYCKSQKILPEEVFVCGDSGNDLSMFRDFPHSFCMSHSPDYMKNSANHLINRVSDLEGYLEDPTKYENDKIKIMKR